MYVVFFMCTHLLPSPPPFSLCVCACVCVCVCVRVRVCVFRAERVCRFVVGRSLGLSEEDRIQVSNFVHQLIKEGIVAKEQFIQVCMTN